MQTQSTWFINRRFLLKILLPVIATLLLFVVALYQIVIPRFEEIVLDRKREMIRELTTSVWHVADRYHREAAQGRMSTAEAQRWTIAQVQNLRYGEEGKDYFWITDFQPRMIVHPFRPDLNGTDLSDFKDSEGKTLFVEIVKTVRTHGDGYVDYTWQWKDDSSRIVPKLSYVKPFRPWGWIIGTGIYIEDVRDEIAALESNVVTISLWITVSISLLLLFITAQNLRAERQRQRAEQEVRESKEKYEALVEASTEGLLMVMGDRQLWFNRTLLTMLGYTDEEARGVELSALFTDDAVARVFDSMETEQIRSALNSHAETGLRRKDGSVIDVLLTVSPVGFYGKTGVVLIVKDMSHHKLIADALDESKQRFSALTNRLSLAVFRTDAGRGLRFVEANAATARLFGCTGLEELQKTELREYFDDEKSFTALRDEVMDSGFVTNRIVRVRNSEHTPVLISLSVAVVSDAAGKAQYCDVLAEDVSEEKKSREDAARLAADLQAPISFLSQPVTPFVRDAVYCRMVDTAADVARLLSRPRDHTVLVRDDAGRTVGMITDEELRAALLSDARGAETGVYEIMRAPVVFAREGDVVHDVLHTFREHACSAAAVRGAGGAIAGTVHAAELERARLHSYDLFLLRLQRAETVGDVRAAHEALRGYVRILIGTGAPLHVITHANTLISDTAGKRLIEIAVRELGPPPRPFVFMALGSEGRGEQTLLTDQDNAIAYADDGGPADDEVHRYFLSLGERVCAALDSVGYAFCKGDVMAQNPRWCQPIRVWKQYFTDWVHTANPQDLLDVGIFFDFRRVCGDEELTTQLRDHLFSALRGNTSVLLHMSQNAIRVRPPTRQLKSEERIDSKWALLPIVDLARIYALKNGVRETGTFDRLARLYEMDVFSSVRYRDIVEACRFLMTQRLRRQASLLERNATPDNMIDAHELADIEKLALRRVLSQTEEFQEKLNIDFKGTV